MIAPDRNGEKDTTLRLTFSRNVWRRPGLMRMLIVPVSREKLASNHGGPWSESAIVCEFEILIRSFAQGAGKVTGFRCR